MAGLVSDFFAVDARRLGMNIELCRPEDLAVLKELQRQERKRQTARSVSCGLARTERDDSA